jgi:hypothetical protein
MRAVEKLVAAGISAIVAAALGGAAAPADVPLPKADGVIATAVPGAQTPSTLSLLLAGQTSPVSVTDGPNSQWTGQCHDCGQAMTFPPAKSSKTCWVCGCGVSAADCITEKTLKHSSSDELLEGLAPGTVLTVTFNTPGQPASGLKTLVIDRHRAMLPVENAAQLTVE